MSAEDKLKREYPGAEVHNEVWQAADHAHKITSPKHLAERLMYIEIMYLVEKFYEERSR